MKFQEDMVYKNLFYRLIFSLFLFLVYIISLNNTYLLFTIGTIIYSIIYYECFKNLKKHFYLIIFYLSFSIFCFYYYFFYFFSIYIFNILMFTIIIFDSFSYFVGLLFGKRNIFKKISPKKSLEGYLGGIFFTNIIFINYLIFIENALNVGRLTIFINFIILFSIIGDLLQSFFKRKNNLKDSSFFLPGHGGFFDRFDSFISSIIFLLFYSVLNLWT